MRSQARSRTCRGAACALLLIALLSTTLPRVAFAADLLIPVDSSGGDAPLVQQPAPPTDSSSTQLIPNTQFVEDPLRQAGGEDDAQRAIERQTEQRNDDDEPRRK